MVDDYGHHPTEIRATLAAARSCGYRHIHVLFQTHRYSRTRDLFDDFSRAFRDADSVELVPIYAAGEQPMEGVNSESLAQAIYTEGTYTGTSANLQSAARAVAARAEPGDLLAALAAALGHRDLLIVLDNCEHVIDAAAELVEALLSAGDRVRVLATSR